MKYYTMVLFSREPSTGKTTLLKVAENTINKGFLRNYLRSLSNKLEDCIIKNVKIKKGKELRIETEEGMYIIKGRKIKGTIENRYIMEISARKEDKNLDFVVQIIELGGHALEALCSDFPDEKLKKRFETVIRAIKMDKAPKILVFVGRAGANIKRKDVEEVIEKLFGKDFKYDELVLVMTHADMLAFDCQPVITTYPCENKVNYNSLIPHENLKERLENILRKKFGDKYLEAIEEIIENKSKKLVEEIMNNMDDNKKEIYDLLSLYRDVVSSISKFDKSSCEMLKKLVEGLQKRGIRITERIYLPFDFLDNMLNFVLRGIYKAVKEGDYDDIKRISELLQEKISVKMKGERRVMSLGELLKIMQETLLEEKAIGAVYKSLDNALYLKYYLFGNKNVRTIADLIIGERMSSYLNYEVLKELENDEVFKRCLKQSNNDRRKALEKYISTKFVKDIFQRIVNIDILKSRGEIEVPNYLKDDLKEFKDIIQRLDIEEQIKKDIINILEKGIKYEELEISIFLDSKGYESIQRKINIDFLKMINDKMKELMKSGKTIFDYVIELYHRGKLGPNYNKLIQIWGSIPEEIPKERQLMSPILLEKFKDKSDVHETAIRIIDSFLSGEIYDIILSLSRSGENSKMIDVYVDERVIDKSYFDFDLWFMVALKYDKLKNHKKIKEDLREASIVEISNFLLYLIKKGIRDYDKLSIYKEKRLKI